MDEFVPRSSADDYRERENLWDEQWPTTSDDSDAHAPEEPDNLDEELGFPDTVGTTDVIAAVRDQEPLTPAIDPPVLPGGGEGIHVATGFGLSPEDETAREPEPRGDEDIHDEALLILRDDSDTSKLALDVVVTSGVVRLRGEVPSAMDAERASDLISYVPGVVDVVDETVVNPDINA